MPRALEGVRALDVSTTYAGAWCTRVLADFGADVCFLEPHPIRELGPFDRDGESIPARYALANKRSVAREDPIVDSWLAHADVIVDTAVAGSEDRAIYDVEAIASKNPSAVHCVITPNGLTGARKTHPGNDLTAYALSGWASVNGFADHAPLKGSGFQASYQTGTMAAAGIVSALVYRLQHPDAGQLLDVSMVEVLSTTFAPGILRSHFSGIPWPRRASVDFTNGPIPVKDGYFALTISRAHFWEQSMKLLGLPDLAQDENLQKPFYRNQHKDEFVDRVQAKMADWTRMDLFDGLAKLRAIAGPVLTMEELGENPHLRERSFFVRPPDSPIEFPGAPFKMSASPWALRNESNEPARALDARSVPRVRAVGAATEDAPGPLAGQRGVVLTQAWAGTFATELLGFMGAEIIQVEVRKRLDSWRGAYDGPMPRKLQDVESAKHPWNCNPLFNSVNLNKQSITLDLSTSEGVELFKELVRHADFVAENFSPRVMGNLGIGYEALKEVKPDIVLLSLSAYGHDGPWCDVPGIGGTIEPTSGMSALNGYLNGPPQNSGQMYPDAVAGIYGFLALALAMHHRALTGEGQYVDLSMQEANLCFVGDAWLEWASAGTLRSPLGNSHMTYAPHGIYPCAGEDRWIAIAAETEAAWGALCDAADRGEWRQRYPDNLARMRDQEALNASIAAWTSDQDRDDLAARLAAAGIMAAPVLNALELSHDETLRERGHLVEVAHAETGTWVQAGVPFNFSRTPIAVTRPAPLQGEHSFQVLERFTGMTAARYAELSQSNVTGIGPPE
jgi:crotonobetainyl-CoA:carnitine CoA-transferase CaiB-like acyl-CoA transferase